MKEDADQAPAGGGSADDSAENGMPHGGKVGKLTRTALQVLGAVPYAGALFAALGSAWSEQEQDRINKFIENWIQMLRDELREKERTITEMMMRIDMSEERVNKKIESPEYQSILKKTFREWGAAENEEKRVFIRNILCNAAASDQVSLDVVRLFLEWIKDYSLFHFKVIGAIYNEEGITRGEIWRKLGKEEVREDSAEADLFRLLIHDLSTGRIVRQHREKDYHGNFLSKGRSERRPSKPSGPRPMKSAFDDEDQYELTELGKQFVHYAMNELAPRITFQQPPEPT